MPCVLRLLCLLGTLQLQPALWSEGGGIGAPPSWIAVQQVRADKHSCACMWWLGAERVVWSNG